MFEGFLGQALYVARFSDRLTQEEVLVQLNERTGRNFSRATFDGMEKDIEIIEPEIFDAWCGIFSHGKVKILKCAQCMQENVKKSDKELLGEIIDHVDYELWRRQNPNQ